MHVKLVLPTAPTWNAEIDRIGSSLDVQNNATVFPYHFLQVVLPSLGGAMVEVSAQDESRTRCILVGFLLPRDVSPKLDGWESDDRRRQHKEYTFRYHDISRGMLSAVTLDEIVQDLRQQLEMADIFTYSPEEDHNFTMTEELVGNALIGRPNREESEKIRELHHEIWQSPPEYIYPSDIHSDEFRLATSLVARVDGEVAGFLFGFHRFDGPELPTEWHNRFRGDIRIESQVMGVSPRFRGMRLGSLLKRAQATEALQHGVQIIHWTADPLMYPNAALNFGLLRAISFTFKPDYYPFRNDLNHVPASRLALTWLIGTDRVRSVPLVGSRSLVLELQPEFVRVNDGYQAFNLDASSEYIAMQIPVNWGDLQRKDIGEAMQWRETTDALFKRYIGVEPGQYVITGVAVDGDDRFLIGHRTDTEVWERLAR